jgi:hypothetical protein
LKPALIGFGFEVRFADFFGSDRVEPGFFGPDSEDFLVFKFEFR